MVKVKVYCKRCGTLINEIELNNPVPESLINHIICRECYNEGKAKLLNELFHNGIVDEEYYDFNNRIWKIVED